MGLLDLLYRKQRHVERLVFGYLDQWEECLDRFRRAMEVYLDEGLSRQFHFLVEETHKREARADDLRRGIEVEMYAKALLPESRRDILEFLEDLDRVPNRAESVLFDIAGQRLEVPPTFHPALAALVAKTLEATAIVLEMARGVFARQQNLRRLVRQVDETESACDYLERALLSRIFESAEPGGVEKLMLREMVSRVGDLSDLAENVADRIMIMSVKRRV